MKYFSLPGIDNKKGALILEALLVIVILSVCLTLVIRSFVSSLRAITYGVDYFRASIFLDNTMFDLLQTKAVGEDFMESAEDVACDVSDSRYKCGFEIKDWLEDDKPENLKTVNAKVKWSSGRKEKEFAVTAYMFDLLKQEE